MIAFADASALVKRYIAEPGAEELDRLAGVFVSALSQVEISSAIARGEWDGRLLPGGGPALLALVDADFDDARSGAGQLAPIDVHEHVLRSASGLVFRHALRAGDAVQLASAIVARDLEPECQHFVCFDHRLRDAAAREGFAVVPRTAT